MGKKKVSPGDDKYKFIGAACLIRLSFYSRERQTNCLTYRSGVSQNQMHRASLDSTDCKAMKLLFQTQTRELSMGRNA